jgi:glycosyltransferase involved in cell wall biosynthesis
VRIAVVPNGIDVAGALLSNRRQRLIVTAGRLVPTKQFEHVVRAFGQASEGVPGWQLRIFGDGRSRARVQRTIRDLGLETQVLLPGVVPDLATVLAKASIVALASATEAFSLVIAEAQAAAVPVVSYDTHAGPRDILEKTGGGLLVPMNSDADLAAGVRLLMTDQGLRDEYGLRGREGSWKFDVSRVTRRWLEVFSEVMSEDGREPPSAIEPSVAPADPP